MLRGRIGGVSATGGEDTWVGNDIWRSRFFSSGVVPVSS